MKWLKTIVLVLAFVAIAVNLTMLMTPDANAYLAPRKVGHNEPTYCYDPNCICNVQCGSYCACSDRFECGPACSAPFID